MKTFRIYSQVQFFSRIRISQDELAEKPTVAFQSAYDNLNSEQMNI